MAYYNNVTTPEILNDGNTVAWYDYTDLNTLTLSVDSSVYLWKDKLGSGHDLVQATLISRPKYTSEGILFDGVDDFLRTNTFTWTQPEMIYIVFKQVTYGGTNHYIFDGNTTGVGQFYQQSSPNNLALYVGGVVIGGVSDLAIDTWGIARVLIDASSKIIINNNAPKTGNASLSSMNGFTLGTRGSSYQNYSNIQVKEIILRKTADSAVTEQIIYDYLNRKYNITVSLNTNTLNLNTVSAAPEILNDGNTVAWYDYADLNTISLTADSSVSRWNDKLGSGHDLIQNTTSGKPKWTTNGILFNGTTNIMKTQTFPYVQPEKIYMVFKIVSYIQTLETYFDGSIGASGRFYYSGTDDFRMSAGTTLRYILGDYSDDWRIARVLFNGSNSQGRFNMLTPVIGDAGTANMNGFTLGGRGDLAYLSNIQVKEIILRNVVDSPSNENAIYNYLSTKYNIATTKPNNIGSFSTLEKGLVLDLPLTSTYAKGTMGTERLTDRTPYERHATNAGTIVSNACTQFTRTDSDTIYGANGTYFTNAFTFAVWVQSDSSLQMMISGKWNFQVDGFTNFVNIDTGIQRTWVHTPGASNQFATGGKVTDGKWHLVGMMCDSSIRGIIFDDTIYSTASTITPIVNTTDTFYIGNGAYGAWDGSMYGYKFWNRCLTATEVKSLYEHGRRILGIKINGAS